MLKNFYQNEILEAGCDEAGRGCLAGPVFAAAVILPQGFHHPLLNDSKQLKEKDREILRPIIEKEAVSFSVAQLGPEKIDEINILKASIQAMHLAIDQLAVPPAFLIIDGNRFVKYRTLPHQCIVKGDAKYASIAAASILAKTYRDAYMRNLHLKYPQYHWDSNKGYPTKAHREAIRKFGATPFHRKSFTLLPRQLELFKK